MDKHFSFQKLSLFRTTIDDGKNNYRVGVSRDAIIMTKLLDCYQTIRTTIVILKP